MYQFDQTLSADFKKTAFEILKSPAKKIVLDLRNNPGGYLQVAQEIAGWFLTQGQVVVVEDFGKGKEKGKVSVFDKLGALVQKAIDCCRE